MESMRFKFDPEWRITLFALVMVPLMVNLGFWQLQRAEEKAALAASWELRQAQPPALLADLWEASPGDLAYRPVTVTGRFREGEYLLLDNSIQDGKYGLQVLSVLDTGDDGDAVLVNRGWIAGDPARLSLPEVPPVEGEVTVRGHVYVAPGEPYLLAEQQFDRSWPKLIQAVEMDKIARVITAGRLFPYPVRMDAGVPGSLAVDWQIVNVTPEKHRGYAIQWFTMAAALVIFYFLRSSNIWQLLRARRTEGS